MFVHVVLFWLQDGTPEPDRRALENDCFALLGKIKSVRQLWAGRAAMTPREVVDNSYDLGLCVVLDDPGGHDAYQVDPLHKEFIARHKPRWKRVQIYDFMQSVRDGWMSDA